MGSGAFFTGDEPGKWGQEPFSQETNQIALFGQK